jgi:hypothetical protein
MVAQPGAWSPFIGGSAATALRSKTFTANAIAHEALNVYVWDSQDAAKAFFNEELAQRLTVLYGVRPSIAFVEIAATVDNAASNKARG